MTQPAATFNHPPSDLDLDYDAIVIGAGISGLYQLYKLREIGMKVRVFESETGVGVPGIGIATRVLALIRKVTRTPIPFHRSFSTNGIGPNILHHSRRF